MHFFRIIIKENLSHKFDIDAVQCDSFQLSGWYWSESIHQLRCSGKKKPQHFNDRYYLNFLIWKILGDIFVCFLVLRKNPQDNNLKGKKTPVICQLLVNSRKRKLLVVVLQNNTWKCIFTLGSGLEVHFSDTVYPCGLEDLWYPGAH